MTYYRRVGDIPRKRHSLHRVEGQVVAEEMVGEEGFSGPSSLLYHRHSPSAIVGIDVADVTLPTFTPNQPVAPYHLRTTKLPAGPADAVTARTALLGNDDVQLLYVTATTTSPLYRNAVGDELVYVQSGSATVESVFGSLAVTTGDYVVVPTGVTHRWVIGADAEAVELLVLQSRSHIHIPPKYLTPTGQLADGAPYSRARPTRSGRPAARRRRGRRSARAHTCRVRPACPPRPPLRRRRLGRLRLPVGAEHPRLRADRRAHSTSRRPCTRRSPAPGSSSARSCRACYDFDPDAVKVPYHHSNVDSDEVLFYSDGDFMSRAGSGIGVGSISLHPAGFIHGPQPGSRERSESQDRTNEVAVMLDTFAPLGLSEAARDVSDPEYPWSWAGGRDCVGGAVRQVSRRGPAVG